MSDKIRDKIRADFQPLLESSQRLRDRHGVDCKVHHLAVAHVAAIDKLFSLLDEGRLPSSRIVSRFGGVIAFTSANDGDPSTDAALELAQESYPISQSDQRGYPCWKDCTCGNTYKGA